MKIFVKLGALSLSMVASCASIDLASNTTGKATNTTSAEITDGVVEVSASDKTRYPDNTAYLYQGSLATILWLQNEPRVDGMDKLLDYAGRTMLRGVTGEILNSQMQQLGALPDSPPPLPEMARGAVQSIRLMMQYAYVTNDYAGSRAARLAEYNSSDARTLTIADTAVRIDGALGRLVSTHTIGVLPSAPPSPTSSLLRPGRYFADSVNEHARALLVTNVVALQHALDRRDATAYGDAFVEIFFAQRDLRLTGVATEALSAHHVNGLLRGQPLDTVIATYVDQTRYPDRPLSVEELSTINQANLLAGKPGVQREPLVAALLLLDEDHQQGELDAIVSSSAICQHINDEAWLVSQYVRIKADGTTAAQITAQIATIVAGI